LICLGTLDHKLKGGARPSVDCAPVHLRQEHARWWIDPSVETKNCHRRGCHTIWPIWICQWRAISEHYAALVTVADNNPHLGSFTLVARELH
jgi:hypothetical protein